MTKPIKPFNEDKAIKLNEDRIIKEITQLIMECDCDTLAKITGDLFGGECIYSIEDYYLFWPDDNYANAFGKIKA